MRPFWRPLTGGALPPTRNRRAPRRYRRRRAPAGAGARRVSPGGNRPAAGMRNRTRIMSQTTSEMPLDIIVAEDEGITRRRLVGTLETMGHCVRAFPTGQEAWEAFDRQPSRVIISDWQMPEMDGTELCR